MPVARGLARAVQFTEPPALPRVYYTGIEIITLLARRFVMGKGLALIALLLFICTAGPWAALAEEPSVFPDKVSTEAFFAAKAAAGGVLDTALQQQALALAKQDVHQVQLFIERYGVDNEWPDPSTQEDVSHYPQHINQLVIGKYPYGQPGFYANPFTANSADELNAQEMPFGWTEQSPGNFSYLQRYDEYGDILAYMLILWGPTADSGFDITGDGKPDGAVMTLESGVPIPGDAPMEPVHGPTVFYSGGKAVTIDFGR
jgi:hypothetical protein